MGSECSEQRHKQQYQLIHEFQHQGLGYIQVYSHKQNNILLASKIISFPTQNELQKYKTDFQLARTCSNLPSLMKLISIKQSENVIAQCRSYDLKIQFEFHEHSLTEQLITKQSILRNYQYKNSIIVEKCRNIQMYNYKEIDLLVGVCREYINNYYREIQVLRMIDHMVSAIYFLHHFQTRHQAVRPDTIFITSSMVNILANKQLLKLESNYEKTLKLLLSNQHIKKNPYLPPQHFQSLKYKQLRIQYVPQKADIFAIGLIALEMCVLQDISSIYDFKLFKIQKSELNRYLVMAKNRYSTELINLLQSMLKLQPIQRISYQKLIDILAPMLQKNIKYYEQVFIQSTDKSSEKNHKQSICSSLELKLQEIDMKINKIYRHRGFEIVHGIHPGTFQEQKSILQELRCSQIFSQKKDNKLFSPSQHKQSFYIDRDFNSNFTNSRRRY